MKFKFSINFPQKSIFGFKILSSIQSSMACYVLLLMGLFLNPFFGLRQNELIAAAFFNIILNISVLILILNLFKKRNQIRKVYFIFLNSFLFIYLPFSLFEIAKNINFLINY